jgi:NAD(P)-dependent dehydrogenase (short-subunit alcohol dehydrogenase family)
MIMATTQQAAGRKVIVITGASSGFGNLTAKALARAGHIVYADMRETAGRNAPRMTDLKQLSAWPPPTGPRGRTAPVTRTLNETDLTQITPERS